MEKAFAGLENKFPLAYKLLQENQMGIGIIGAEDFQLLMANEVYLESIKTFYDTKENLIGLSLKAFIKDFKGSNIESILLNAIDSGKTTYLNEIKISSDELEHRYWDIILVPLKEAGKVNYIISMMKDTSEEVKNKKYSQDQTFMIEEKMDGLKHDKDALVEIENRLIRAQALAHVGNWEIDLESKVMWASEEAYKIYGIEYHSPYLPLAFFQGCVNKENRAEMDNALKRLIEENAGYDMEFRINRVSDGEERVIHSVAIKDFNSASKQVKLLGVIQDITENRANEEKIKHLAYYDALTELPNRILFIDRLKVAISHAKRMKTKLAVIIIDIDNFRKINDTFGYIIGDELIIKAGEGLRNTLRENETLSRFSGDEFALFIEDIKHKEEINRFINRVKGIFNKTFLINENVIHISCCFGIALFPDDNDNPYELVKCAETAIYKAKEIGNNNYQYFNKDIKEEILYKLNIERCLRDAITKNELLLHYQPQIDSKTGEMRGYEALLRFNSKELGLLSPLEFIPIAEETGMIVPIGEWVLRTACRDNKCWHETHGFKKIVSVNISALQLKQKNFAEMVKSILIETDLKPEFLELEITESVLIESFDFVIDILMEISNMGVKIAMDDFGTGYSSLNYLRKLPFNTLKIDKDFVQDIKADSKESYLASTIIILAHKLGFEVVAEGIETNAQLDFLMQSDCDHLQGYLFSRPIDKKQLTDLIKIDRNELLKYTKKEG